MTSSIEERMRLLRDNTVFMPDIQELLDYCLGQVQGVFGEQEPGWPRYKLEPLDPPGVPLTIGLRTADGSPDNVTIRLNTGRSWVGCVYEAAHEAVHWLNPGLGPGRYLEEAIATQNSLDVVDRIFGQDGLNKCCVPPKYVYAMRLASVIDFDLIRLGQRLRGKTSSLTLVERATILDLHPQVPGDIVDRVLLPFPRT